MPRLGRMPELQGSLALCAVGRALSSNSCAGSATHDFGTRRERMIDEVGAGGGAPGCEGVRHATFDLAVDEGVGWSVAGQPVSGRVRSRLGNLCKRAGHPGARSTCCPFCQIAMRRARLITPEPLSPYVDKPFREASLEFCGRCAHWLFWVTEDRCMERMRSTLAVSVAARFSAPLPEACHVELAQVLRRSPAGWHHLSPRGLEQLVAGIFRATYREAEVTHVGGPRDGGVDVLLVLANGKRWLIQVKRRASPLAREPVGTVRDILGAMAQKGQRFGMVVSTASAFTCDAVAAVREAGTHGNIVELVDRGLLNLMLGPLVPRRPWASLHSVPHLAGPLTHMERAIETAIWPDQLGLFE